MQYTIKDEIVARAKRHYIPGHAWHLTHRCHKREFLFKFAKNRNRWMYWLYLAKKEYSLILLDYIVTSNHIHLFLLVYDNTGRMVIPKSIQLLAGRVGREYNIRKKRSDAFWEDRYHSTAVETGKHLMRCIIYIDLNMVRTGTINHPSEWFWSGFNEIQAPRRKKKLISYDKLSELAGFDSYENFQPVRLHFR
jgi:putative transposase